MPLKSDVVLEFESYEVEDTGIRMIFVSFDPGPGQDSRHSIFLTDADLAAITDQPGLTALVQSKLERSIRASGIASKLDPFIGQTLTVA